MGFEGQRAPLAPFFIRSHHPKTGQAEAKAVV
jgi:hypothetical protein